MTKGLLFAWLLLQGIPIPPSDSGTVTGVLRNPDGTSASGVRVAAMAQDAAAKEAAGTALVSLAETDSTGRFQLDNIPPGRYLIIAGMVEQPTYYPGTPNSDQGQIIQITPGARVQGIEFMLKTALQMEYSGWVIPVDVRIEGASRFPVFANGTFPMLTLGPTQASLLHSRIAPVGTPREYRASVVNLPPGYRVKSMTFGGTDLRTGTVRISTTDLPASNSVIYMNNTIDAVGSATVPTSIVITLAADPSTTPAKPARVTARLPGPEARSVYISGRAGVLYSDGTAEFDAVPLGRHLITALDISRPAVNPFAASVVVGSQDVEGILLNPVSILPVDATIPREPESADGQPPGTVALPVTLRGVVRSQGTGQPVISGTLTLSGYDKLTVAISRDGRFEIPNLLPGTYAMEISVFDHFTLRRTVAIGTEDVELDLGIRRVY